MPSIVINPPFHTANPCHFANAPFISELSVAPVPAESVSPFVPPNNKLSVDLLDRDVSDGIDAETDEEGAGIKLSYDQLTKQRATCASVIVRRNHFFG